MRENLRKIYRAIFPKKIRQEIYKVKEKFRGKKNLFLIVQFLPDAWGPLTTWTHYAVFLRYAKEKHLVPIFVPKLDEKLRFLIEEEYRGDINIWNLYFDQPVLHFSFKVNHFFKLWSIYSRRYGLRNAFKLFSDEPETLVKIILESGCSIINGTPDYSFLDEIRTGNLPLGDRYFSFYTKMYRFFPFSRTILEYAENLRLELFPQNEKILGVSARRAFECYHYWRSEWTPVGTHGIRGSVDSLILSIKEKLREYGYTYFFLTCDDREFLESVKAEFGSACIFQNRPVQHFFENGKPIQKYDWEKVYQEPLASKMFKRKKKSSETSQSLKQAASVFSRESKDSYQFVKTSWTLSCQ